MPKKSDVSYIPSASLDQLDLFQRNSLDESSIHESREDLLSPPVYLSNSLYELVDLLIQEIAQLRIDRYKKKVGDRDVPYRFLILVPSEEKRSWLLNQLALRHISTFDIEVVTPEGLQYSLQKIPIPSWRSSLLPALQESIARATESHHSPFDPHTLYWASRSFEMEVASRLFSLPKKSFKVEDEKTEVVWQAFQQAFADMVWTKERLYDEGDFLYFSRYQAFFVFGVTSLAQSLLDYCLEVLLHGIAGSLFVFSPCLHFWSDSKSDEEVKRALDMVKRRDCSHEVIKRYEMLLYDRNTLLANLGVMGREFAQEIEEKDLSTHPFYRLAESVCIRSPYREYVIPEYVKTFSSSQSKLEDAVPSLLKRVQADILLYIPQRKEPDIIDQEDQSMRCVATTTLYQEVERFYQYVRYEAPLGDVHEIGSIIAIVPDLHLYREPFLRYFHAEQPLKVQFWEGALYQSSDDQKGSIEEWFDVLFQMVRGEPWKSDKGAHGSLSTRGSYAVKAFATHPITLKAIGIQSNDALSETAQETHFLSFLEKLNLTWSISKDHAQRELLRHGLCMSFETSAAGHLIERRQAILEEIVGVKKGDGSFTQGVDYDLLNSLLSCIGLLESLEKIWKIPCLEEEMRTIEELTISIQASMELILNENVVLDETDLEVFEATCQLFHGLHACCPHVKMPVSWFHEAFLRELRRMMRREVPPPWKGHIIVAERRQFDLVPCDGIALLGLSQDIFPEKSKDHFFSHLEQCSPKVPQDISIIDRSLFLESLLYPSEWWYASAYGLNPTESRASLSLFSPLVRDLIRYLDINYRFPQGALFSETCLRVVKSYMGSLLSHRRGWSYQEKKEGDDFLGSSLSQECEKKEALSQNCSTTRLISDLIQLGKSPLDVFLEFSFTMKSSHFFLLENHQKKRGSQAIFPSQFAMTEYLRLLLEGENGDLLEKKMSQRWPKGIPGKLIRESCLQEFQDIVEELAWLQDKDRTSSILHLILFDHEYETKKKATSSGLKEVVCVRPVIQVSAEEKFYLMGVLKHSFEEHMALVTTRWEQELFQRFPEYLIRLAIFHKYKIGSQTCVVVRQKEIIEFNLDEHQLFKLLLSWCRFYDEAKKTPFPYTFNIVKALLSKIEDSSDEEATAEMLLGIIEDESEYNTNLSTLLPLYTREYIQKVFHLWKVRAEELYGPFFSFLEERKQSSKREG